MSHLNTVQFGGHGDMDMMVCTLICECGLLLTHFSRKLVHLVLSSYWHLVKLSTGNGDLTLAEQRTHFAAWVFLKSPILLGTDVRGFIRRIANDHLIARPH